MRHDGFAGLQDLYYFDLPRGTVVLTVDQGPSPMGGHTISLCRFEEGSRLFPLTRPSEVGVAGFDRLWADDPFPEIQAACASAYDVPDETVARLVQALERLEGVTAQPSPPGGVRARPDSGGPSMKLFTRSPGDEVTFVRKYDETRTEPITGVTGVLHYEIFKAPTGEAAGAFLQSKTVSEPLHFVVVETPGGNWGKDITGIYEE